jgi:protein TonB
LNDGQNPVWHRPQAISFAAVLLLHAGALYAVTRAVDYAPPAISVPITISLAPATEIKRADPKPVRKIAKAPSPQVATPERVVETPPESDQPSQAQVTPPDHEAADLNNPKILYPKLSERLREQGPVTLKVFINPDGSARDVSVLKSSGYSRLDDAARAAAERMRYKPARQGNHTIGSWYSFTVRFTLDKKG